MQSGKEIKIQETITREEEYYMASQWKLMWRKFKKHKLALVGTIILAVLYFGAIFSDFLAPYDKYKRYKELIYCPPQKIHFLHEGRLQLRPFVYGWDKEFDEETFLTKYTEDKTKRYAVRFFVHGDPYKFWGLIKTDIHLFGAEGAGTLFLFGTDRLGRDLLSRNMYASRVSLSVGLVGITISFFLGCLLGGLSGYYGGNVDNVIQRVVELIISLPTIPLWMAFSAALPAHWSPIKIYFGITIILSLVGWASLARVVRGKLLELREEDFVMAAKIAGTREGKIIVGHLLPSFLSYLIIDLTLAVPAMILGETALSFLGLGIRAPAVSWGTLLQDAQDILAVVIYPWLLIPALFVIITVLAFNFLGDGLRDAADPYK